MFYGREKRHVPFSLIAKYYPILLLKDEILEFFHILHPFNIRSTYETIDDYEIFYYLIIPRSIIILLLNPCLKRILFIVYALYTLYFVFIINA